MSVVAELPQASLGEFGARLTHPDAVVRRIALADFFDELQSEALPWLVWCLRQDPDVTVRVEAAALLVAWEQPEVVSALCGPLRVCLN